MRRDPYHLGPVVPVITVQISGRNDDPRPVSVLQDGNLAMVGSKSCWHVDFDGLDVGRQWIVIAPRSQENEAVRFLSCEEILETEPADVHHEVEVKAFFYHSQADVQQLREGHAEGLAPGLGDLLHAS